MKQAFGIAAALLMFLPGIIFGQSAEFGKVLSPEDIGAHKWIFKSVAPEGSVVVFRCDTYVNGKLDARNEDISYDPGKERAESVTLLDLGLFRGTPGFHFVANVINDVDGNEMSESSFSQKPPELKLTFKYRHGNPTPDVTTYVFTIFDEPYAKALKRVPHLPKIPGKGNWNVGVGIDISAK